MNPEQGKAFLKALGAKKVSHSGKWLRASCPLAFALHQNHHDTNPSFALTVEVDKPSRYNCFACGHGSALDLIQQMEFHGYQSADYQLAREILDSEKLEVTPLSPYSEFSKPEELWVFQPWPEEFLNDYPSVLGIPLAMEYLKSRDMPLDQVAALDLRYDFTRAMVCFPIRDAYGQLSGMRGRSVLPEVSGAAKHYDYSHKDKNNTRGVWYNEQSLQLPGKVVVVEGQFDAARVLERYPKCVANLTAKPSFEKILKLALTPGLVLIPDNDLTGEMTVKKYHDGLEKYKTPISVLWLPDSVKDPSDCHPDFLYESLLPHLQ